MNLPPHIEPDDKVVLYDGVCRLCNGWSKFLLKHDRIALNRYTLFGKYDECVIPSRSDFHRFLDHG